MPSANEFTGHTVMKWVELPYEVVSSTKKFQFLVNLLMGLLISFARQVNWSQLDDLVMIGIPLFEWFKSTSAHCPMDSDYNTYYNNNNNNGKNGNNENKEDQHDSECVEQQGGVLSITAEDLKCLKNWLKENFDKYTEKAVAMRIREFL
ncbi:unnamed protein product [Anisakis simplex]|uniref:PWI domain-containing protein n=1 Tax=Anisakis simplex TaxID=6269 RepID=A0A0M3KCG7_ANISI|nr:unnamed protein product [Anisakis simplex]